MVDTKRESVCGKQKKRKKIKEKMVRDSQKTVGWKGLPGTSNLAYYIKF